MKETYPKKFVSRKAFLAWLTRTREGNALCREAVRETARCFPWVQLLAVQHSTHIGLYSNIYQEALAYTAISVDQENSSLRDALISDELPPAWRRVFQHGHIADISQRELSPVTKLQQLESDWRVGAWEK